MALKSCSRETGSCIREEDETHIMVLKELHTDRESGLVVAIYPGI
jgi:hypothetical protein